jgi:hypothetical protein
VKHRLTELSGESWYYAAMEMTVKLPDGLVEELKALAARRGTTLDALTASALECEVAPARENRPRHRVRLPLISSQHPGSLNLTNAQIEELLRD